MGMRTVTRRKPAALGLTALLALTMLSGCVPTPSHTSTPTPKVTPLFATDAEALAAATKAYAAYLKMSDTIAHDGGAHPERIEEFVTEKWSEQETKAFNKLLSMGYRQLGQSKYGRVRLQSRSESDNGRANIAVYVCVDSSGTRILDSAGTDVTPKDRVTKFTSIVEFQNSAKEPRRLILENYEPWSGTSIC